MAPFLENRYGKEARISLSVLREKRIRLRRFGYDPLDHALQGAVQKQILPRLPAAGSTAAKTESIDWKQDPDSCLGLAANRRASGPRVLADLQPIANASRPRSPGRRGSSVGPLRPGRK